MAQLSVPYSIYAHDPENQVPGACAAYCIACGVHSDLVPRGDVFVCSDRWLCTERVKGIISRPSLPAARTRAAGSGDRSNTAGGQPA